MTYSARSQSGSAGDGVPSQILWIRETVVESAQQEVRAMRQNMATALADERAQMAQRAQAEP